MSFFGARPAAALEPKDIEVPNLPTDSISALAFSPTADILAVASWSNEVRLYEVNPQGQAVGKAAYSHEGPVLDVTWSKVGSLAFVERACRARSKLTGPFVHAQDGSKVFSAGADKAARMFDLATMQPQQVRSCPAGLLRIACSLRGTGN